MRDHQNKEVANRQPSRTKFEPARKLLLGKGFRAAIFLTSACLLTLAALATAVPSNMAYAQGAVCGTFDNPNITDPAQGNTNSVATNTACGNGAVANGTSGATAVGSSSTASSDGSSAYGQSSTASGSGSSAFGASSTANGDFSSAYGIASTASGLQSSAFGVGSTAGDLNDSAFGANSTASGSGSSAFGVGSTASGPNGTAVGNGAQAQGIQSSAFGTATLAAHDSSTAIGTGAVTTRANQVMVGAASTTYTTPGITSAASKTEQGAPTHLVTSNAAGDLAAYTFAELGFASPGDVASLQSQINRLGRRDKELAEGIATIASLAQPILRSGQHFGMTAGWGGYDNANAVGFSAAGVLADNLLRPGGGTLALYGGVGFGTSEGEVAGRAGVSFGW